ncbi:MAG TPA: hypothetical protein VK057_11705 [Bacillota bacterium]|nr:hypothetical protein [Bacillota bacterium]
MERTVKVLLLTVTSLILLLPGFISTSAVYAENNESKNEIAIEIEPKGVLFNVTNMKPGDWAPRTVTVYNDGKWEFDYIVKIEPVGDSRMLFNELELEVKQSDEVLFNGKLKDFTELNPRTLLPSEKEELDFIIRFPEHLGNEFQGLDAKFNIIYSAEDKQAIGSKGKNEKSIEGIIGSGNGGGSPLPDTATTIFSILLIGSMLMIVGLSLLLASYFRKLKRKEI